MTNKKINKAIEQVKSLYNECRTEVLNNGRLQYDDLIDERVRCYGNDTEDILRGYCYEIDDILEEFTDEEERKDFFWKLSDHIHNIDEYVDENYEQVGVDFFFGYSSDEGNFFNISEIPEEMRDKIEESDAKQRVRDIVEDIVVEAKNLVQLCGEKCTSVTLDASDAEHAGSKMILYYDTNREAFEIPFDLVQKYEFWHVSRLQELTRKYYDYPDNDLMAFGIDCLRDSDIPHPSFLDDDWNVWTCALFSESREYDCERVQFKLEDVTNEADREKLQKLLDKAYDMLDEEEEEEV